MRDMASSCATINVAACYIICSRLQETGHAAETEIPMPKRTNPPTKPAVRGSPSGRPIMVLLDLLGRRWSRRIWWELRDDWPPWHCLPPAVAQAPPPVVQARLSDLRQADLVELIPGDGYRLTA